MANPAAIAWRGCFFLLVSLSALGQSTWSLVPESAPRGATVILSGPATTTVTEVSFASQIGSSIAADLNTYEEGLIELFVPRAAASGMVEVRSGNSVVAVLPFSVLSDPPWINIATIAPPGTVGTPAAVAVEPATGTAIVADSFNHRIVRVTPTGEIHVIAGSGRPGFRDGPAVDAEFKQPQGVALLPDGAILVADTSNHVIRKIDLDGNVSTIAGTGHPGHRDGNPADAEFKRPIGLAVSANGTVWVADQANHVIRRINAEGTVATEAGTGSPGTTDGPAPSAEFHEPTGVHVDLNGDLYIADRLGHTIRRFRSGLVETIAGTGSPGWQSGQALSSRFHEPAGVLLHESKLLIADSRNHVIRSLDLGFFETASIAGTGKPGLIDGVPPSAEFKSPTGLGGSGAVWVADTGNGAVRALLQRLNVSGFYPADPVEGDILRLFGSGFAPGFLEVRLGDQPIPWEFESSTMIRLVLPEEITGAHDLRLQSLAGAIVVPLDIAPARQLVRLTMQVSPTTLDIGQDAAASVLAEFSDSLIEDVTASSVWSISDPAVLELLGSPGRVRAVAAGSATLTGTFESLSASAIISVRPPESLPPDPSTIAPPIDSTRPSSFADSVGFLYEGELPVQTDVMPGVIDSRRVSVIRGRVLSSEGSGLPGVTLSVVGHPELGRTLSRQDGRFDLAVNGGGRVVITFAKSGFIAAQRTIDSAWNRYELLEDIMLVPYDPVVTEIHFGAGSSTQVARGSIVTDDDGPRQATMIFAPGTSAYMILPDGTRQEASALSIRATEYTVGPEGHLKMPAELPPQSAYTYCVELSADEAVEANAAGVEFSVPVAFYVTNFLDFPVGEPVPIGYYDRMRAAWVPMPNGRIIKILTVEGGSVLIDATGDDVTDDPAGLGIGLDELQRLSSLFVAGQTVWRVAVDHFSPLDLNWPISFTLAAPEGASKPNQPTPKGEIKPDETCKASGSVIECQAQGLTEYLPIAGTDFRLAYSSITVPGRSGSRTVEVSLTGETLPPDLRSVELRLAIAGREFEYAYAPIPRLKQTFEWDGKDAYGRTVHGAQDLTIVVSYVYPAVYRSIAAGTYFGEFAPEGLPLAEARRPGALWDEQHVALHNNDPRSVGLGGWAIDVHHRLEPGGGGLLFGDGSRRSSDQVAGTVETVAGREPPRGCGVYGQLGTLAYLGEPTAIKMLPDGDVLFTARECGKVLRWKRTTGTVHLIAGAYSDYGGSGDGGPAQNAGMYNPQGLAIARDGSIFIAEGNRIRRVSVDGIITRVAGTGQAASYGDGGSALLAALNDPWDLEIGPDGALYIRDRANWKIRRVSLDGRISTFAGTGNHNRFTGDGPATAVGIAPEDMVFTADGSLWLAGTDGIFRITPDGYLKRFATLPSGYWRSLTVAPDGSLLMAGIEYRSGNQWVVRRITLDGDLIELFSAVTGRNEQAWYGSDAWFAGDGGLAGAAVYAFPSQIAADSEGNLFVADRWNRRIRRIAGLAPRRVGSETWVPSSDGSSLYFFDGDGRHKSTYTADTGALVLSFLYEEDGRLSAIDDRYGNRTVIRRGASGGLEIVAPGGQTTTLTLGSDGWLESVRNASGTHRMTYGPGGLLASFATPRDHEYRFEYDADGRLTKDS
ncbi:MAG: hypothetical protein ABR517_07625, partial [Thermoanaerobaculia bacterium]